MRKYVLEFFRRGLTACGFGPFVLAILYLILKHQNVIETLTVEQVCIGIFTLSALAFIAGGMNVVYQIEHLPLMTAILIHGIVLYFSYLFTYLLNDWIEQGITPILIFSLIFILGYLIIWILIYSITKKRAERLNKLLKHQKTSKP